MIVSFSVMSLTSFPSEWSHSWPQLLFFSCQRYSSTKDSLANPTWPFQAVDLHWHDLFATTPSVHFYPWCVGHVSWASESASLSHHLLLSPTVLLLCCIPSCQQVDGVVQKRMQVDGMMPIRRVWAPLRMATHALLIEAKKLPLQLFK